MVDLDTPDIHNALARILDSEMFRKSPKLRNVLRYIVDEELAGRGENLKAYAIGVDALGKPETFDSQLDPIVRVTMGRVRSALELYYSGDGRGETVLLSIPKGAYRPVFSNRDIEPDTLSTRPKQSKVGLSQSTYIALGVGAMALSIALLAVSWRPASIEPDQNLSNDANQIVVAVRSAPATASNDASRAHSVEFSRNLRAALSRNKALSIKSTSQTTDTKVQPADFVVETLILQTGSNQRHSVELTNSRTSSVIWARAYDHKLGVSGPAEDNMVRKIARELNTQIFAARHRTLSRRDVDTLSPYELFVMATWVPGPAKNSLNWEKERARLARLAIEKDPDFGPAHSVLADKLAYLAAVDGPSDTQAAAKAAAASAKRALELAPEDANTVFNVAQYRWHAGQLDASIRTMKRVIELDPHHALAHALLLVIPHTCQPAPDDALKAAIAFDKTLGADNPIRWVTLTWLGWLHLNRGELALALEAEERAAQIFQIPYSIMRHAVVLQQLERNEDAAKLILSHRKNWPNIDPAHFSNTTMPRICRDAESADPMLGFYAQLTEAMAQRLNVQ